MSTYALKISTALPDLQVVKTIAHKAFSTLRRWVQRLSPRHKQARTLVQDAATWALSVIASNTGYDITLNAARLAAECVYSSIVTICRYTTRAIGYTTRAGYQLIALINPEWAKTVEDTVEQFIVEPILNTALATDSLIRTIGEHAWVQAHHHTVVGVTMSTARTLAAVLGINTLTDAVIAAKIVQLLPWTMSPIAWITQPMNALLVTGVVFIAALVIGSTVSEPEPPTPELHPVWDIDDAISRLTINVDLDGQIHVNGIPESTPAVVTQELISIATTAAATRLEKIRRHRTTLTRDDRRLLTKVARSAIRHTLSGALHAA
jgi:hypothetical protein